MEQPGEQELDVERHNRPYKRTIRERPVIFTCEYCGDEKTELHYPGPAPRYCATCYTEAQRSINRQRVRAYRERQRQKVYSEPDHQANR